MAPFGTAVGLTSVFTLGAIPLLGSLPPLVLADSPELVTTTVTSTITTKFPAATAVPNSTHVGPVSADEAEGAVRNGTLHIVDDDPVYKYAGCWTDTTEFPGQAHAFDGPSLNLARAMTVPKCIKYCETAKNPGRGPNGVGWSFAAIEFAHECYCGSALSRHSFHLPDSVCDTPCAGSNKTACGGNLALSVYNVTQKEDKPGDGGQGNGDKSGDDGSRSGEDNAPKDEAILQAVGVGVLVFAVTLAIGAGLL
ncbi:hypothetical protein F4818DRAFT_88904 [Hypoxylon cercidicola]|nr:hypothetical protein F4818DRAFT_88904 [Hypoxylon cercidicola]